MAPREEIIALLRGQVACPLISCIGELGWLERMAEGPFDHESFADAVDSTAFAAVMAYLIALELVEPGANGGFAVTRLGAVVFRRYGTFCILNSYERYMQSLRSILIPDGAPRPQVDRIRNVIGSGAMHERKFFGPALELLSDTEFQCIADIGCGDGKFLLNCVRRFPRAGLLAVDSSAVAVDATLKRLHVACPDVKVSGTLADGADVASWSKHLACGGDSSAVLVSLWFLVHEISRNDPESVIRFFELLQQHCPGATILMGEVVRMPPALLAKNRSTSILPELLLLHDLSRQGVLGWEEWQYIAEQIPYVRVAERSFDLVRGPGATSQPSSFVWCLAPA